MNTKDFLPNSSHNSPIPSPLPNRGGDGVGAEPDPLLSAEDDLRTVEFIKAYLPQELKERFSDDDLFYFIDVLADYFVDSGLLDQEPDADGCIEVDTEAAAKHLADAARKDHIGDFDPEDLVWVVQGELEYGE